MKLKFLLRPSLYYRSNFFPVIMIKEGAYSKESHIMCLRWSNQLPGVWPDPDWGKCWVIYKLKKIG